MKTIKSHEIETKLIPILKMIVKLFMENYEGDFKIIISKKGSNLNIYQTTDNDLSGQNDDNESARNMQTETDTKEESKTSETGGRSSSTSYFSEILKRIIERPGTEKIYDTQTKSSKPKKLVLDIIEKDSDDGADDRYKLVPKIMKTLQERGFIIPDTYRIPSSLPKGIILPYSKETTKKDSDCLLSRTYRSASPRKKTYHSLPPRRKQ